MNPFIRTIFLLIALLAFADESFAARTSQVSITKNGTGQGTVTGTPGTINCGSVCVSGRLKEGTSITLTAVPKVGSTFVKWAGVPCTGTTCSFTIRLDVKVFATFDKTDNVPPTVPKMSSVTPLTDRIQVQYESSIDVSGIGAYYTERCSILIGFTSCSNFLRIGQSPTTLYEDLTATPGIRYLYRGQSKDNAPIPNFSLYSGIGSGMIPIPPPMVTGFTQDATGFLVTLGSTTPTEIHLEYGDVNGTEFKLFTMSDVIAGHINFLFPLGTSWGCAFAVDAAGVVNRTTYVCGRTVDQPRTMSATLSWDANKELDLAGYNIYHSTTSMLYTDPPINQTKDQNSYMFDALSLGVKHYFSMTAFDNQGNESQFSEEVSK